MGVERENAGRSMAARVVADLADRASGSGAAAVRLSTGILPELSDLALRARDLEGPPVHFGLDLTPAQAIDAEPLLSRAARHLEQGPHRLELGLLGLGPFAEADPAEPAWQMLRALRILRGLVARWPDSIHLSEADALKPAARADARDFDLAVARHFSLASPSARASDDLPDDPTDMATGLDTSGWPSCCTRALSGYGQLDPRLLPWLILLRRCQEPKPISPTLDPFRAIAHLPCSFHCRSSGDLAAAGTGTGDGVMDWAAHPVLFLLDHRDCWLELISDGKSKRRFYFTAGRSHGDDPRLRALMAGGEMDIQAGRILISRDGHPVSSFLLTAAVFSLERAFDARFWAECALERLLPLAPPAAVATDSAEEVQPGAEQVAPPPDPESVALLERLTSADPPGGGLRVCGWQASTGRHVTARLEHDALLRGQPLAVSIEAAVGAGKHYLKVGSFALSFSDATPLDTVGRRSAFRQFAVWLKGIG